MFLFFFHLIINLINYYYVFAVCECQYGTCIGDTDECKCYEGFTGVKCDIHNPSSAFSTTNKIIVAVVPVVIVVIMGIAACMHSLLIHYLFIY